MSIRNRTQSRPDTGHMRSISLFCSFIHQCSLKPHRKWCQWKGGYPEAKGVKQKEQKERLNYAKLVGKSLTTRIMEWWVMREVEEWVFTTASEYLKKLQEAWLREFRIYWKIKVRKPNIDFQTCLNYANSFLSYILHSNLFLTMFQ